MVSTIGGTVRTTELPNLLANSKRPCEEKAGTKVRRRRVCKGPSLAEDGVPCNWDRTESVDTESKQEVEEQGQPEAEEVEEQGQPQEDGEEEEKEEEEEVKPLGVEGGELLARQHQGKKQPQQEEQPRQYYTMWYKHKNAVGIRQKFLPRRQIAWIRKLGATREALEKLAGELIELLETKQLPEAGAKDWIHRTLGKP